MKKIPIILALILLCTGVVSYKFSLLNKLPYFNPRSSEAFYWTESAFHFRHFEMVAEGKGIPALDKDIQYPEGIDTVRYVTPVMERVTGNIYRLFFSGMSPHIFLCRFTFIFSTLSVLAIFLVGRIAWRSDIAGLLCALFYAFIPASLTRTAGGGFIREDFALPFIFFSFACFLYVMRRERLFMTVLGSVLLVVGLAAWHVTQLFLGLFMVGLAVVYLVTKGEGMPRKDLSVFVGVMMMAALLLPVLRVKYFIFSPAMMIGYGLLTVSYIPAFRKKRWRDVALAAAVIFVFVAASFVIQRLTGSYSHVYELIMNKIRFLGTLPQDPLKLSFEARSMWSSAFVSPRLDELPLLLSSTLLFGALGTATLIYRAVKKKADSVDIMVLYFVVTSFILFLMIHRISVFVAFFLALSVGVLTLFEKRVLRNIIYGCLVIAFLQQVITMGEVSLVAFRPSQNDMIGLYSYLRKNTDRSAAVLTSFQLGPSVALYGKRPVVLHSKFESKVLRDKVKDVYTSLFKDEDAFYQICKRYGASFFVYQIDMVIGRGPGSIKYLVGSTFLKTDSAAFLFQFAPEKLKNFKLVYQNQTYRVFSVDGAPVKETALQYDSIYDLSVFTGGEKLGDIMEDGDIGSGIRRLSSPETQRDLGDRFFASGDYGTAATQYSRALFMNNSDAEAMRNLGITFLKMGEKNKAAEALCRAVRLDTKFDMASLDINDVDILFMLGSDQFERRKFVSTEGIFKKIVAIVPDSEKGWYGIGMALFLQKKFDEAEAAFNKVISLNPENFRGHEALGKVYAAQGDFEKSLKSVKKSLSINPSQPILNQAIKALHKEIEKKQKAQ